MPGVKNVTAQVLGGSAVVLDSVTTVRDAFEQLDLDGSYAVTVNGEPATMDQHLEEYQFVSFAPAVKGGK